MRTELITFLTVEEIAAHLAKFFGVPSYNDWVAKMSPDGEWHHGTFHFFDLEPEERWITANHRQHIAEARERGHVEWDWELIAVLNEACKSGDIPLGTYAVTLDDVAIEESQRTRSVSVLEYDNDVEELLKRLIHWKDESNWIADVRAPHYSNDTVHFFEVDPVAADLPENQALLAAAQARHKVVSHEEVTAVLNQAAKDGLTPAGPTIIEICW